MGEDLGPRNKESECESRWVIEVGIVAAGSGMGCSERASHGFTRRGQASEWLALDGLVARMRSTASQDTLSLSFAVVARK